MKSRYFIEPKMLLRKAVSGKPIKILNINKIIIFYRGFREAFRDIQEDVVLIYNVITDVIPSNYSGLKASSGLLVSQN